MSDLSQMTPRELQSRAMELEDEVERLREGLGEFAKRDNWDELSIGGSHSGWVWNGDDENPRAFARKLLEAKP
jgi:hypothetical protein